MPFNKLLDWGRLDCYRILLEQCEIAESIYTWTLMFQIHLIFLLLETDFFCVCACVCVCVCGLCVWCVEIYWSFTTHVAATESNMLRNMYKVN